MTARLLPLALAVWTAAVFAFVFAPIAASVVFSFNSDRFPTIPLGEFTWTWYETVWADPDAWTSTLNSLQVSLASSAIATALGFATAYTDFRFGFRFKPAYLALALLPPTIPLIILALASLAWFSRIGLSGTLWAVIAAHAVLTAPFAMAIIRLRLSQMDASLEAAAWNLGASEARALREVILPFCRPAIISAFCLTAAVSFDEFTIAWFVSGLEKTIPVHVLEIVQGNIDPQVNAIGSMVFGASMALVALAQLVFMFGGARREEGSQ
ncbi:MAG: ABC transporter permease [Pseudomonadota bacterium]